MQHTLISGDNHIDLTYLPVLDLWSSQAPQKWKKLAPRVEERNDGQHWFVDDTDRGMWNGVGPGFLPYTKWRVRPYRRDAAASASSGISIPAACRSRRRWNCASPISIATGSPRKIIYGCLMVNDLIDSADLRIWVNQRYNDWVADFAKRADSNRVFPLAIIPNTDPKEAAAEVRRCAPRWG